MSGVTPPGFANVRDRISFETSSARVGQDTVKHGAPVSLGHLVKVFGGVGGRLPWPY